MNKWISILAAALLIISSAIVVAAQTTTVTQTPTTVTKTVQNPDGTFTVIEYPVGKEVQLTFNPVTLTKSKAVGTILRDDNGTRIVLNVTDVPADVSAINVYAVDDAGVVSSLGPVVLANGTGKFSATTPLSKFMLIGAPDTSLTAYDPNAKIYFRSAVPAGFTAIPLSTVATTATTPTTVATTTTTPAAVATTTTTATEVVQNPDGTYSVIEYPIGKETLVTLDPVNITGAKGVATILRDDKGTRIKLNLTGLPNDLTGLTLYAVDPAGAVTALGPIAVTNGVGTFASTTPLNRFMLFASPETALTTYDPNTKVLFRSTVPAGFAVIPHTMNPVGETVGATTTSGTTPATTSTVPMLNIPAYKKGDDTKLKVDFSGAMAGARANVFIEPHKNGKETEVKMRFHELKEAPTGKVYVLWAVSPDNQFFKLGEIVNVKGRNEAEIKANTTLDDFGLLVTMEDLGAVKTIVTPVGERLGVIQIVP
ncbi:MAG TPA: hypothetical protein VGW76_21340 [Pyrinomonadaceae bacterium]|nr:hypothetical protein [Pyrinomonadaceae bacterium]